MTEEARLYRVWFDCPDCDVSFTRHMSVPGLADCPSCGAADLSDVGYGPADKDDR